ncbi:MAG TPA: trypsin-like peptidase domain-containing protein [Thermoanaerobaculia bacterium]|nr:trypsin-like peptidase domain-containing protein [Thermoanaerobaculia bacterium]
MNEIAAAGVVALLAFGSLRCAASPGAASAFSEKPAVPSEEPAAGDSAVPKEPTAAVEFHKLLLKLPRDLVVGSVRTGRGCTDHGPLTWKASREGSVGDDLGGLLMDELSAAGYTVVGDRDQLFDDPHGRRAEYVIAGVVRDVKANVCYAMGRKRAGTAEASLTVDWQVYSHRSKSVALKETTTGTSLFPGAVDEPGGEAITRAFVSAARALLADNRFHDLVAGRGGDRLPRRAGAPVFVAWEAPLVPPAEPASIESMISDSRMSVVTVFAGKSMGSGFLISSDGYVLTNQHVPGQSRYVRVRFVTGREVNGEVVRSDAVRDVALIKLETDIYRCLPLGESSRIAPGADVFAIGTPLSEKLGQTVTKGILSGFGEEDGLRILRSDVAIHQGSSGGPLLDRSGAVVGLSVSGYMVLPEGYGVGLNSFIPIEEALSALYIKRPDTK